MSDDQKKLTKKQKFEERRKRMRIASQAARLHRKLNEEMEKNKAKGGWGETAKGEGINEDWVSKVGAMHQKLTQGVEMAKQKRKKRLSKHLER